jgi:hypothetical protein
MHLHENPTGSHRYFGLHCRVAKRNERLGPPSAPAFDVALDIAACAGIVMAGLHPGRPRFSRWLQ